MSTTTATAYDLDAATLAAEAAGREAAAAGKNSEHPTYEGDLAPSDVDAICEAAGVESWRAFDRFDSKRLDQAFRDAYAAAEALTPAERADAIAVKAGGEWAEELLAECHTDKEREGAIEAASVEDLKRMAFDSLRDDLEAAGLRAEWDAREDDLIDTMCEATVAAMREA